MPSEPTPPTTQNDGFRWMYSYDYVIIIRKFFKTTTLEKYYHGMVPNTTPPYNVDFSCF